MVKSQLISTIADKVQVGEKDIADSINSILESMSSSLSGGKRIEIRGFGSFSLHYRPPRNAHNPKTGEKVVTAAKYAPHFKPGKDMRERIDDAKANVAIKDMSHEKDDDDEGGMSNPWA